MSGAPPAPTPADRPATVSAAPPAIHVDAAVAARGVHLRLDVAPGRVLAVLGPNGAGKSTLLGLLSGLVRPSSGTVRVGGRVLADAGDTGDERFVPPHARGVVSLAQDPLLFPHLSAAENVAFGPRSAGVPRARARDGARRELAEVGCEDLADRRPAQLSGGQQQRVALARALAVDPSVVLLDEPLSALDVDVAAEMRRVLADRLRGGDRTAVIVTHDLLDVLALADDVAVVEDGAVVGQGPALEVMRRPRSRFAARLAGMNLVEGVVEARGATLALRAEDGTVLVGRADPSVTAGEPGVAVFRPSAAAVYRSRPGGSPRNVLPVRITALEQLAGVVRARCTVLAMAPTVAVVEGSRSADSYATAAAGAVPRSPAGPAAPSGPVAGTQGAPRLSRTELAADLTPTAAAELGLAPGVEVLLVLKAVEVDIYTRHAAP